MRDHAQDAMTAAAPSPAALKRIHVIFKTHLDVGFTNRADTVLRLYRERFIPQALKVAASMRREGGDRFIWTTGSYLVWEYLERGDAAARRAMEEAIQHGDIAWHALPFTTHSELLNASLLEDALGIARDLDARFGRTTIAAKMTDVTGHTLGLVRPLARAGVKLLHIGVNPASAYPQVPPLFRWRDRDAEILVMYHTTYGDLATPGAAPGGRDGLLFAHTGDNQGPQAPAKLREEFAHVRAAFPGAEVVASTLDAFTRTLEPLASALPVLTCDLGDNWIHGAGSDQRKVAEYRALARLRAGWAARWGQGAPAALASRIRRFARRLLLVPEHTWGMDIKTHLKDETTWSNGDLARARRTAKYRRVEGSWREQRDYIGQAIAELGRTRLAAEARHAVSGTRPRDIGRGGWRPLADDAVVATRHFRIGLSPATGAIVRLKQGRRQWADERHAIGAFRYQSFSAEDFRRYYAQYARDTHLHEWWIIRDITKYGMPDDIAESAWWQPLVADCQHRRTQDADELQARLTMPREACRRYGCPAQVRLHWRLPDEAPRLELTLDWFHKRATRLPEALWLGMTPLVEEPESWRLTKIGVDIDPAAVPVGGSRHLHAVERARYAAADGDLRITPVDTTLVAPGRPHLIEFTPEPPALAGGMHWCLQNNTWCTNFPMWYEDDGRCRFVLELATAAATP